MDKFIRMEIKMGCELCEERENVCAKLKRQETAIIRNRIAYCNTACHFGLKVSGNEAQKVYAYRLLFFYFFL